MNFKKDIHGPRTTVRHALTTAGNFVPEAAMRTWLSQGLGDSVDAQVQANVAARGAAPTFQGMKLVSAQTSKFSSKKGITILQYKRLSGSFGSLANPPWIVRGEVGFRYQKRFLGGDGTELLDAGGSPVFDSTTQEPLTRIAPLGVTNFYVRAVFVGPSPLSTIESYAGKVASNAIFGGAAQTTKYLGATFYMYKDGAQREWILGHHFQHCISWKDYGLNPDRTEVKVVYPLAADLAAIPEIPAGASDL
jgi:hypothetical protein